MNEHPEPEQSFEDRRAHPRETVRHLSEIIVTLHGEANGCIVHNHSEGGAMIEVSSRQVPDRFILTNHAKKTRAVCEVAWRCGNLIGVQYVSGERPLRN